jgi:hypothetical protein
MADKTAAQNGSHPPKSAELRRSSKSFDYEGELRRLQI